MSIYLMYIIILVITALIITISKDKSKTLNKLGKISIMTSIITIILSIVLTIIIKNSIQFINISIFIDYILRRIILNNLLIFIAGVIELTIGKYVFKKHYS